MNKPPDWVYKLKKFGDDLGVFRNRYRKHIFWVEFPLLVSTLTILIICYGQGLVYSSTLSYWLLYYLFWWVGLWREWRKLK